MIYGNLFDFKRCSFSVKLYEAALKSDYGCPTYNDVAFVGMEFWRD